MGILSSVPTTLRAVAPNAAGRSGGGSVELNRRALRERLNEKGIPKVGIVVFFLLGLLLILAQVWNTINVDSSLKDLKTPANVRSIVLRIQSYPSSKTTTMMLGKEEISELLHVVSRTHYPSRKQKKAYDYTIIGLVRLENGRYIHLTFYVDRRSSVINFHISNGQGSQDFWTNDSKGFFSRMVKND